MDGVLWWQKKMKKIKKKIREEKRISKLAAFRAHTKPTTTMTDDYGK